MGLWGMPKYEFLFPRAITVTFVCLQHSNLY
jgi:hypothetical protein